MYELIQLTEKCYYIECPAKIGIYKPEDNGVYLIDSGSDKDTAKKVLKKLNENGWELKAVFNTHSHADHIGGNKYLQAQTGCKIYAKGIECDFTNHPVLEGAFLYGGMPFSELSHKFILAQQSEAYPLCDEVLPEGLSTIVLEGHSFDMVGFLSDDGVAFIADCLSSKATIDKYGIGFIYDVEKYIDTLDNIKTLKADIFVPSHAEPADNICGLAEYNINKVQEIANKIVEFCNEPICFDVLLKKLFDTYAMTMTHQQYVLVGSTVRSYISFLKKQGKLDMIFEENTMLLKAVKE